MKTKIIFLFLVVIVCPAFGGTSGIRQDSSEAFFTEVKKAAADHQDLWNENLYGPLLLIDPSTRKITANYPDASGILKNEGGFYRGVFPESMNIANTSIDWNGVRWAMIMLPLPENKEERLNLLLHELFHAAQPDLGFTPYNPNNAHLDKKAGRVYLKLELEAIKQALSADSKDQMRLHLTDAFCFRKYRHMLFPGSDTLENQLELNEGIAEFTGAICSGRDDNEMKEHLINAIDKSMSFPSYVRSFAYQTIPAYGYVLSAEDKRWNLKINNKTDLTAFLIDEFGLKMPDNLEKKVQEISNSYGYGDIYKEENNREEKLKRQAAEYKTKFLENSHLTLSFENMSISFDPRNITSLEGYGNVYPSIRVTDNWGILEVQNGSLLSPNWDKITVSEPLKIDSGSVTGDGWILHLNEGWSVEKQSDNNYKLIKKGL